MTAGCPYERMLGRVKVPVLFTHHGRHVDEATGRLTGAVSDLQASRAGEIIKAAGVQYEYVSLPDAAHAMHAADPSRFADILTRWAKALPA
jgi:pimeloyl-ACP methyl ester carboxylesterase